MANKNVKLKDGNDYLFPQTKVINLIDATTGTADIVAATLDAQLKYATVEPTAAASGGLRFVELSGVPTTYNDGWCYIDTSQENEFLKVGAKEVQNLKFGTSQVKSMWYGDKLIWHEPIILNEFTLGLGSNDNINSLVILMRKTPLSLTITADDVEGKDTTTTIYWTLVYDLGDGETITTTGTDISEPFPQNPSTTESIQRTITYTKEGLTATTTITQGPYIEQSYTITLQPGLTSYGFTEDTTSGLSLDQTIYDGPYQSYNWNVNNSYAVARIDVTGYTEFTIWLNSYAESSYDYSIAGAIDATSYSTSNTNNAYNGNGYSTGSSSSAGNYSNTRSFQKIPDGAGASKLSTSYWRKITYALDGGSHHIYITYRKDSSAHSNYDRGYFVIER